MKWAIKSLLFNALTTNLYFQAIKLKRFFRCKNSSLFFLFSHCNQKNHFWSLFLSNWIFILWFLFLLPFTISILSVSLFNWKLFFNKSTYNSWNEEEVTFLFRTRKNPTEEKTSRLPQNYYFFFSEEIHSIYV